MTRIYGKWAGNPKGTPEDETRCVEVVSQGGRSILFAQCQHKRGYGKDGLYCKVHAKQHPADDIKTREVFIAYYKYKSVLTKLTIAFETPKTCIVIEHEDLIGNNYFGKNQKIRKRDYDFCDTEAESRQLLAGILQRIINQTENKLKTLKQELAQIEGEVI